MLARPADQITVLEIMEALEGPLVVVPEGMPVMPTETDAILSSLWDELRATVRQHLAKTTLQALADRKQLRNDELMYEI